MVDENDKSLDEGRTYAKQVIASLLAAAAIVAIVIVAVTLELGPTSTAELDAQEDVLKEKVELQEERREAAEERRER